jgi:tetratricopeptide (TPR) repeat protein
VVLVLLVVLVVLLQAGSLAFPEELTLSVYRGLVSEYRDGSFRSAAERLVQFERERVGELNDTLLRTLDIERLDERRVLRSAILLSAEAALSARTPGGTDFFLNEAMRLSARLEDGAESEELRKRIHVAVAYSLYRRHRIADALRVLEPAARRYDSDPEVQFAFGSLTELSGWLNSRASLLEQAAGAYRRTLDARPDHSRALVRLGRVLVLLGEHEAALPYVQSGLEHGVPNAEHVVGLLSLGDVLRKKSSVGEAIEAYRNARSIDPDSQAAAVALANALWVSGRMDEARALVDESFAINEKDTDDSIQEYMMGDSSSHFVLWSLLREARQ